MLVRSAQSAIAPQAAIRPIYRRHSITDHSPSPSDGPDSGCDIDPNRMAGLIATIPFKSIVSGKYVHYQCAEADLLICRLPDGPHVIENLCSHMRQPLNRGRMSGSTISCPVHGGVFDICTGSALKFPAGRPIRAFASQVIDGIVYVDVANAPKSTAKGHTGTAS